jgi:hypothetical protein
MPDSMTFKARDGPGKCRFCETSPATLELEIRCVQDNSLEQGPCCSTCAHNLLDALARVVPQP